MNFPKIIDNDRDEITAEFDGKEIRGWSYKDRSERYIKMQKAQEFVEGYYQGAKGKPELAAACRAQHAWSYCEEHGLGSFQQRGTLCCHSNYLTAKALATMNGVDFDQKYQGNKRLIVWPQVRLEESDEAEAEALVILALEHEKAGATT